MSWERPLLLDLFCGAGGAGMGYHKAGFEVVGVDIKRQKNYPFEFYQGDALDFLREHGSEFDVIHASPPCQFYSRLSNPQYPERKNEHPNLIPTTRDLLKLSGRPYVIENVAGSPLENPLVLCGRDFGLKVYRHRLFESNVLLLGIPHTPHRDQTPKAGTRGNNISPKGFICVASTTSNVKYARFAMGIDWMTQRELGQSIPPAFTEFIGGQLMVAVSIGRR